MLRAALLGCGLLLVVTGLAVAAPEPDQQQTVIDQGIVTSVGGPEDQRLAQTIMPTIPGLLTEIQLAIECAPQTVLATEVRDAAGGPGGNILTLEQTSGSNFPSGPAFKRVVFSRPVFLPAEVSFAVVLWAAGPGCGAFTSPQNVDAYPRGGLFGAQGPNGQFRGASNDLAFRTFVDRRCGVPELVGSSREEVGQMLTRHGCTAATRQAYSRAVQTGLVISQSPAAGTLLAFGAPVSVVVSRGAPPCIVPRLRGKTLRQARRALTRANCRLGRVSRRPAARRLRGRVVGQRPSAGRRLPDRSRVNVVLGR